MTSQVEENYLKALLYLSNDKGEVSVNELSRHLDIKMPTVTSMMKRLAFKNLVYYESYRPLRLTDLGKKEAALVLRKHRLTEMFLVQKMGFGWEQVHFIAEQVEHIHSPAFFDKMDELLGFPKIDPHGSPIPDAQGNIEHKGYIKLSEAEIGDSLQLAAVASTSDDFLKFLNAKRITLGTPMKVISIEPFDQTMEVWHPQCLKEVLSHKVCESLLVEKVNTP